MKPRHLKYHKTWNDERLKCIHVSDDVRYKYTYESKKIR